MSASLEKYGLDGKALYDAWEHELEELVNKHRINPDPVADEQQLHTLKQKLHTSLQENATKSARVRSTFYLCVVVTILSALMYPSLPSSVGFMPLLLAGAATFYTKAIQQKNLERCRQAIVDFDKTFFGGEVLYKWKHAIEL